jgi:hypothetical protein
MASFSFGDITVDTTAPVAQTTQYTLILGTTGSDSVTLGSDLADFETLNMFNGNLTWTGANGAITAISSEIDFLVTDEHTYLNLNTNRSATIEGFIMSERSRAVLSNEWVLALQTGQLTVSYAQLLGDTDAFDTVISGIGGDVILADYRLDENIELIEILGSYQGGALIDFGLSAA